MFTALPPCPPPCDDATGANETTLPPQQFCFTTTTTGPVDHPGRMYDIELPINPGFAVESLQVDAISNPANIVWEVDDPDGERFRQSLTTFIEGRVPAAATVTITNPNAGVAQVCGVAEPMTIHIECVRLDQNPPNLIELIYNGGQDMIQNPAYNESPALNPPVSQGNYGFRLLSRQDDPGPFPGNQPANDALCTTNANRGWETNDIGRTFEIWGQDIVNGSDVTPTPRGTPVQEMTSDGPPPGGRSTIWQTFQAPSSGNFIIRVVHGARDAGENHRITLDNGDTDDAQNGDLIDDVTNNVIVVTNSAGSPGPWTTFDASIPLNAGSTYTLALSTNNPVAGARGGLFTDMRAYIDRPGVRATAVTDDETCVITTEETTNTTVCEFWQPRVTNGDITDWVNVATGETMTNAAFWAQVPAPGCCTSESGDGEGGSVSAGNLAFSHDICALVGGVRQTLHRYVITDQSGGVVAATIYGDDGAPVSVSDWTPGACGGDTAVVATSEEGCADGVRYTRIRYSTVNGNGLVLSTRDVYLNAAGVAVTTAPTNFELGACPAPAEFDTSILCDPGTGDPVIVVTTYSGAGVPSSNAYNIDGTPYAGSIAALVICSGATIESDPREMCDSGVTTFIRWFVLDNGEPTGATFDTNVDGSPYTPTGTVTLGRCAVAEAQVVETSELGCAGGVVWQRIRSALYDESGVPVAVVYHYADGNGTEQLVEPAGFNLGPCPSAADAGTANIVAVCSDVATDGVTTGPELLTNGKFDQSIGLGATSVAGPGWTTNYTVPSGGNLFSGAGAGAATWMYYDSTNRATAFNGSAPATLDPIGGGKAIGVNVGPSLTTPIIQWANVYLENGKSYSFECDAGIVFGPFGVSVAIDGVNQFPISAPGASGVWQHTKTTFTFTGTTGYHAVGIQSNNGTPGGNDHAFDNFSLHMIDDAVSPEVTTPVNYTEVVKAVIDQIVKTSGCHDDRRDKLVETLIAKTPPSPVSITGTVTHSRATAGGSTAANLASVTFTNVGTTDATVAGGAVSPGESVTFNAYFDNAAQAFVRLPAIAYVASATAILSISTQT